MLKKFVVLSLVVCLIHGFTTPSNAGQRQPSRILQLDNNNNNDENDSSNISPTSRVIRQILDEMKSSPFIAEKHSEHVQSPSVTHLFKNTPMARMPDDWKLRFVESWAGRALEAVMKEEQEYLGDWKLEKIVEAAGDYDEESVRDEIETVVNSTRIVMYSFLDCPWCLAAKQLLQSEYGFATMTIVELEFLGRKGKAVRAELAKRTKRTSMPCIFVDGEPIGGFTDGGPIGVGLQAMHMRGELLKALQQSEDA